MVKIEMNGIKIECETVEDAERILKVLADKPAIQYIPMPPAISPSPWPQPDYVAGTEITCHPASTPQTFHSLHHTGAHAICGYIF